MNIRPAPPPPPMPDVYNALQHLNDAKAALNRYCWNRAQVEDALRSAEHFITLAKESLK